MENDGGPLPEKESCFIYEKEDLITLRPGREHAWLDGVIERLLQACRCRIITVSFSSNATVQVHTKVATIVPFLLEGRSYRILTQSSLYKSYKGHPREDR